MLSGDSEKSVAELADMKRIVHQANKQVEEMRRKWLQSQDDCKKLERTLAKELGDGLDTEQVEEYQAPG